MPNPFLLRTIEDLTIEDERSFRHVGLYADLKALLKRDRFTFRILPPGPSARWDRALVLNLAFWADTASGDILVDEHVPADVVTHAAWHHAAAKALARDGKLSVPALLLGESIASAFDIYLLGRLVGHFPDSDFLETQVPAMAEAAEAAGLSPEGFQALVQAAQADPDAAFASLRALLFDATTALYACDTAAQGLAVLEGFDDHPYAPLLHHYELANWVLSSRVHGPPSQGPDEAVVAVDAALRTERQPLEWLAAAWLR